MSFQRVGLFRYLGKTVTNQNFIHKEIKRRLKSGNAWYYSVQNLLSSSLLSKNMKVKKHRDMVLPVVMSWSLTLREERRLTMFENRVLRKIFGPKRDEVTGGGENYIRECFMICTAHQILFG